MEFNIHKIHFKGKEYLIFSLNELVPNSPQFNEEVNDNLEMLFGDDASNVIFFPSKVNFYGFKNIEDE